MKPKDYQYEIDGNYYKRSRHGVFMWVNDHWIKSTYKLPRRGKA